MTTTIDPKLQHLLDVYGADQRRWPAEVARQFADLRVRDAAARDALQETAALDQVLARARTVSIGQQHSLADRIMAQVQAEAAVKDATASASGNVMTLPQRAVRIAPARPAPLGSRMRRSADWRAAAALAAALVLGVGVGMSGSVNTTFQAVAETVGVGLDRSVLAFNDEQGDAMAALDDEDVL